MYIVAEEELQNDTEDGNIIILFSTWLTPRKIECFWPSAKSSKQFNRLLQKHQEPDEDWPVIKLKRKFFETDDLILARKKAREAEFTSDLTDGEISLKRKIRRRQISSDEENNRDFLDSFYKSSVKKKKPRDIFENNSTIKPNSLSNAHNYPEARTPEPTVPCIVPTSAASSAYMDTVDKTRTSDHSTAAGSSLTPSVTGGYYYNSMKILNTILEQNNQILTWNYRTQNEGEITAIIRTTKRIFKLETEKEIEDNIKIWLKHAPQQTKLEEKKLLARVNFTI